jgi:hypothetical protein
MYSTLLGRFVSADPLSSGGLNRYMYVHGNPLKFVDLSGYDAAILCGTNHACQSPVGQDFGNQYLLTGGANFDDLDEYRAWVINYWKYHERTFAGGEDIAFAMMQYAIVVERWGAEAILEVFHVTFLDTCETGIGCLGGNIFNDKLGGNLERYENAFSKLRDAAPRSIDTLVGFSMGASVVERILEDAAGRGYHPEMAILIQALHNAFATHLTARDVPTTRILTVNDPRSIAKGGVIPGAFNVLTTECTDALHHCTQPTVAEFALRTASQPMTPTGDLYLQRGAAFYGLTVSFTPFQPIAAPLP